MNSVDFLAKLANYYNVDGTDENIREKLATFAKILNSTEQSSRYNYDYEKTFEALLIHHKFKDFPMLADVFRYLKKYPKAENEKDGDSDDVKRRKFVVTRYGVKYEFCEVFGDWEDIHTVSEFKKLAENFKNSDNCDTNARIEIEEVFDKE